MNDQSRRTFLRGAGVVAGAATATALIPAGSALAGRPDAGASAPNDVEQAEATTGSLVAYVKDARTGQISVLSGDREVVVTDRKLAQRLARLAD